MPTANSLLRGCGVAAARRTFNPQSVGSNPTGLTFCGVWLSGESGVLTRRRSKVRFLSRRLGIQNTNGIVADKVMHRSLKPDNVGSIPTDPTHREAKDLRLQAKGEYLKPLVLSLKPNTDL